MPLDSRSRMRTPFAPGLDLPPPFRAVALREVGDAFAHAMRIAADAGAGTLVHVGRFDLAEFAVVLEPEEPLRTARRTLYAGLTALADALAVHAPPEKPISFDWPDAIRIDGGLVGGARLAWPAGADEDAPPSWLVFGAMIRTVAMGEQEPGLHPLSRRARRRRDLISAPDRLIESFRAPSHGRRRCLAAGRLRRSGEELFVARCAGKGRAPRYRRQRRSSGASRRQDSGRTPTTRARAGDAVMARSSDRRATSVSAP